MVVEKPRQGSTKSQGFKSGLIFGLIVGSGCFLITIKIIQLISSLK